MMNDIEKAEIIELKSELERMAQCLSKIVEGQYTIDESLILSVLTAIQYRKATRDEEILFETEPILRRVSLDGHNISKKELIAILRSIGARSIVKYSRETHTQERRWAMSKKHFEELYKKSLDTISKQCDSNTINEGGKSDEEIQSLLLDKELGRTARG